VNPESLQHLKYLTVKLGFADAYTINFVDYASLLYLHELEARYNEKNKAR